MAAAVSVAVGRWRQGLDGLLQRVAPAFARVESRGCARSLVTGLMSRLDQRNCWTLAEAAGQPNPYGFQHLLSRASWDDAAVRAEVRAYVHEHLPAGDRACPRVLVIDETADVKKGTKTIGVQRQYSGTAGRVENCQIAVYAALATHAGHAAIDVRLYLPRVWTDDRERCRRAGVPDGIEFATKPELAADMITDTIAAGVGFDYVTGDEAYGDNTALRRRLQQAGVPFVLAVSSTNPVTTVATGKTTAGHLVKRLPPRAWQTRSAGQGAKGHRRYQWARITLPTQPDQPDQQGHTSLLARRNRHTGELAYYRCWSPGRVSLQQLVTVAGMRWRVEETFQGAKGLAALDQHQVRTWTSWHRWTTLAILAHTFLAITRATEPDEPDEPDDPNQPTLIPLTCNEIRHLLTIAAAAQPTWNLHLHWHIWRRRHQATAKRHHYQRQQAFAA